MILHRDKLGIALRGQSVQGSDKVQFILAGGKQGVDDLHGDLNFDLGLLGILLVKDMNDQIVALLGDANVAIIALNGDELTVSRGADGFDEGAEVDVIDMGVVDLDLAVMDAFLVDGGENFFGEFERDIDADASVLMTRTCNQRSLDTDVVDWLGLAGAVVDCAKAPNGERTAAAVARREILAKKPRLRSDMTGCLLTGAAPVVEDRYESAGRKVSEKIGG
jgi:hypothetical protein